MWVKMGNMTFSDENIDNVKVFGSIFSVILCKSCVKYIECNKKMIKMLKRLDFNRFLLKDS